MHVLDRRLGIFAAGLSSVLMLSACGGDGDLTDDGGENDDTAASECETDVAPPDAGDLDAPFTDPVEPEGEDQKEINLALVPWEEAIAVTNMWYVILEEKGYEPEITELDIAPVYQGLANGDLDLYVDMWLPQTHGDYWEEHGDNMEHFTPWYDNARLTLSVPEYMEDINTIDDLRENAELFDNRIVGIEAGSGLFRTTEDHAIPGYCLDDYEQVESSTAAMLAELDSAYSAEEPIVVTLWRPHIAYAQYDLKDLEDPRGMMGEAETTDPVAREGFSEDFPHFRNWLDNFELNDEELGDLEYMTLDEYEDDPQEGARQWLADNPEVLERTLGDDAEGLEF
ncbi:glycine betaine ABC transporter substrate-binding protein [Spiractinospora alimapuensis]|uniref:glycine betaine ABC transporter substrate-binding protein n=1 Tax=Spiractinospora alimapuensis TaxID=2820884 RepID=UPI001F2FBE33|nr:glycine betaine ABC transporter substrate-binding protein [Spiractinospora alimapuensis]QVQ50715.1 glycine betaine ABC transporter substrate-binding protein [Spiractinospora alimapuensis]